ncbi:Ger(x)C family spore germination protein [Alkaliphilus serpentinus]|uniref:Ger(X)C family spore germination protein n=1 Tax=Alkaliphilus serpentinus TaxID=1482731 RepID=A0A833HQA5_9FIRM|nr:Ger(x)C family spore germination protein [Alkaliphilus serpentinus]KAB3530716.1 Ger(x)C family spore germination protein [Alkaliphilus serpentinus]
MKKLLKFLTLFVALGLLTSCWDAKNLEELLIIYTVGFDVSKEDPEKLSITVAFPTIIEGAPKDKAEVTTQSPSLGGGEQNLQNKVYREISYGNTRVVIFSEELARKGIYHHIDSMLREPLFPATSRFVIVNTRAIDLINYDPPMSLFVSEFLFDAVRQSNRYTAVPFTTLRNFNHQLFTDGIEPALPYIVYDSEGESITINCIALFFEDRMVDIIRDDMAMAFMLLRGEVNHGFITAPLPEDDKHHLTISLTGGHTKIKTSVKDDVLYINQEVIINADLSEFTRVDSIFDAAMLESFEKIMEDYLDDLLSTTIERMKKNRCDNIGYGLHVRANHPDFFEKDEWCCLFLDAVVEAKSDVRIKKVGISH